MKHMKLATATILAALTLPIFPQAEADPKPAAPVTAAPAEQPEDALIQITATAEEIERSIKQAIIDIQSSRAMTPEESGRFWIPAMIAEIEQDAFEIGPLEAKPREFVRGPFLGVNAKPLDLETTKELGLKRSTGLLVNYVAGKGPAWDAGLKKGDVLTKFNDQLLVNAEQFAVLVRSQAIGDTITLHGLRDGEPIKLEAKLGEADMTLLGPGGKDLDQEWRVQLNPGHPGGAPVSPLRPEVEVRPGVWIGDGWGELRQLAPGDDAIPQDVRKMLDQMQQQMAQQRADMDQQMHELRLQLDLDLDELRGPGGKQMQAAMVQFDGEHRISISNRDGQSQLKVEDKAGAVLYDGPLPEDGQIEGLPDDAQKKVDQMLQNTRIEFHKAPAPLDEPKPVPNEPMPIS